MTQSQMILLGVKHVCDFSEQVERSLIEFKPDIICVEADETSFLHLADNENMPRWIKIYAKYQKLRAKIHGKPSGKEYEMAIKYAVEHEISYEIIDMDVNTILNETKRGPFRYFNQFLLQERNQFMANKLKEIVKNYRTIIVIVGYMHLQGLSKILKSMDIPVRNIYLNKQGSLNQ